MTLLEILSLQLGPAIAKAILKFWLKDKELAIDTASGIVDLIKSRTSDLIAQQKARRQFEEIGERVAESLLPIFEMEGANLDEGGRSAVAYALSSTLDKAQIDAQLIVERNLDPTTLADYLLGVSLHSTEHFSQDELALFRRIIADVSTYIVDIASQLPSFTEQTFAEVLKREKYLIETVDRVLEEVVRIRESSELANPKAEAARFETKYLLAVKRKLDEVELFGVDVTTASRRHSLSVAYITLSVEPNSRNTPEQPHAGDVDRSKQDSEPVAAVVPVDEALADSQRLLIRGDAGSGKTTLLQWIAVHAASRDLEGRISGWNDAVPFLIRLRQCADSQLPAPEDWPGLVAPTISGMMPRGWVHEQLISGRAIVLVDGVDEVSPSRRDDVRRWLKELIENYDPAHFIVTSRPSAIGEKWLIQEGFDEVELQPMGIGDIHAFIEHWHTAVREMLTEEDEKNVLASLADHLKGVIHQSRAIRGLATNPLLCAMLCALHRDRHRQLPTDRIELYEAGCYMLLERRDIERQIELRDYPRLGYRQKRVLLEDLAYWFLTNGWSEAPIESTDQRLSLTLSRMEGIPQSVTSSDVRRYLVERSGLLREPVKGRLDFAHRTFQEFLAAKAALDEGDIGLLIRNAHDDQWREVIILAAGLGSMKLRGMLIKELITRGDKESRHRHQLHLLAVACLETSVDLEQDLKAELGKRLVDLVPPTNMTEAKALASAGELAVPYLAKGESHVATTAAACVRALALIGGELALDALARYSREWRQTVISELIKAWGHFDREEYARRVLASNPAITQLELIPAYSLEGVQYLTNLTSLTLGGSWRVPDLTPLAGLTNLQHLRLLHFGPYVDLPALTGLAELRSLGIIGGPKLRDLNAIGSLTKLQSLALVSCPSLEDLGPLNRLSEVRSLTLLGLRELSSLEPLAGMINLTHLVLEGCTKLVDLRPLAGLKNLAQLRIDGSPHITSLGPLADLANLTRLTVVGCDGVVELGSLAGLTKLTDLEISNCRGLSDLEPLQNLRRLATLDLTGCWQIRNLEPLASLTDLRSLALGKNFQAAISSRFELSEMRARLVEIRDLSPIARLRNLVHLDLIAAWQLSDLNPLAGLTNLTDLNLSQCSQITDLSPLVGLTNLTDLNLSQCSQLKDLNPLANLSSLTHLDLSRCVRITDLVPLSRLDNLTYLDLSHCNQITDLSPVDRLSRLHFIIRSLLPEKEGESTIIKKS